MVVAPGAAGDFGVLPNHSLLMSLLRPGVIEIWRGQPGDAADLRRRRLRRGQPARLHRARRGGDAGRGDRPARRRAAPQERRRTISAEAKDDAERAAAEREIAIAEAQIQAAGG